MPEVFDLILQDDPLGQLIDPQQTYVVGQILENVPVQQNVYNNGNSYEHTQTSASNTWTFDHNLGRKITAALVEDTGGNDWACQITNNTINNVTLYLGLAMAGKAQVI